MADAAEADRILDRVAAALHVAADIQARNLVAGRILGGAGEGVAVLIGLQAADAHEHRGRAPGAGVERAVLQREHAAGVLAEVGVIALAAELVVALHARARVLQRLAGVAQLREELVEGIRLEVVGVGLRGNLRVLAVGEVGVALVLVLRDDVAQAAVVGRHVGDLLRPLAVVDLEGGLIRLQLDLVFQLLARDGLVHEALAVLVELQERRHAHAAAHVMGHRGVEILHLRADPRAHAQAVAGGAGLALHVHAHHAQRAQVRDLLLHDFRREVLHDALVGAVVAGGQDDALGRVELDIAVAVLRIAHDDAGHAARVVLEQLGGEAAEEGLRAQLDGLVQVGLHDEALLILAAGAELHGGREGRELLVPVVVVLRLRPGQRHKNALVKLLLRDRLTGGIADRQLRIRADEPVDGFPGVVGPALDDGALVAVGALAHQAVDDDVGVHDVRAAPALVQRAVEHGVLAGAAVEGRALLDDGDAGALLSRCARGAHAGQARAHDDDVHVDHLIDRRGLRLLAEPVALVCRSALHDRRDLHRLALGLRDTGLRSVDDRLAGDRHAGHGVDLRTLRG